MTSVHSSSISSSRSSSSFRSLPLINAASQLFNPPPLNTHQRRAKRERNGLCRNCGQSKLFRRRASLMKGILMEPITKKEESYKGRCLLCHSIEDIMAQLDVKERLANYDQDVTCTHDYRVLQYLVFAPCCQRIFGCWKCHDEKRDCRLSMNRLDVKKLVCKICQTKQSCKNEKCMECDTILAKYHCQICRGWMNNCMVCREEMLTSSSTQCLRNLPCGHSLPLPHTSSNLWGNIFILEDYFCVGRMSIHFVSKNGGYAKDGGVYVSFEHEHYRKKTLMDGKTPWPLRMKFTRYNWCAETFIFQGEVDIKHIYGSGVMGVDKNGKDVEATAWQFVLKINQHYKGVVSGTRYSREKSGNQHVAEEYGLDASGRISNTYWNAAAVPHDPLIQKEGCPIQDAAYRAITLRQLMEIKALIYRRCIAEKWTSTNLNHPQNKNQSTYLQPTDVTFYDLTEHLIKPTIGESHTTNNSYVEIVVCKRQRPKWFVSHWWGTPVLEFIKCLQGHARDRNLGYDAPYWIAAFALNIWEDDEQLGGADDNYFGNSSFYKAMELSEGVVSILDRKGMYFTRTWCRFELLLTFSEFEKHLYDVYTLCENKHAEEDISVGMTDGAVSVDFRGASSQHQRQSKFPISTFITALKVRASKTEATKEIDRKRILNIICNVNADCLDKTDPLPIHPNYTKVDGMIQGKLAVYFYRRKLESGMNMELLHRILYDAPLFRLGRKVVFDECEQFRSEACKFALSLPETVSELDLSYSSVGFENSREFAVGFGRLKNLTSFKLDLSRNALCCVEKLCEEMSAFAQLRELDLSFWNTNLTSIYFLGLALCNFMGLEYLSLNFVNCGGISQVATLATSLGNMLNMKRLKLDFQFSSLTNESIIDLCEAVKKLGNLEELHLHLTNISTLSGAVRRNLAQNFYSMRDLEAAFKNI